MTLRNYLKNRPITTTSSDPFSNNKKNAVIYVINTKPSKCIPLCMPLAEKMLTDTELDKEIDRIEHLLSFLRLVVRKGKTQSEPVPS